MCIYINDLLSKRLASADPLPWNTCMFSNVWIAWHSREALDDAFKPVRSWLGEGWERCLDKKYKPKSQSIACI